MARLREADERGLTQTRPVPYEDRVCVVFRRGPCDGCLSDVKCNVVAGVFQDGDCLQKESLFACASCAAKFYTDGALLAMEFGETAFPMYAA